MDAAERDRALCDTLKRVLKLSKVSHLLSKILINFWKKNSKVSHLLRRRHISELHAADRP